MPGAGRAPRPRGEGAELGPDGRVAQSSAVGLGHSVGTGEGPVASVVEEDVVHPAQDLPTVCSYKSRAVLGDHRVRDANDRARVARKDPLAARAGDAALEIEVRPVNS